MNLEFYLFDVDHGQAAALRLPHGEWCKFDLGRTTYFSPTQYIRGISGHGNQFRYYKATVSHLHGDHTADHEELFSALPQFMRVVIADAEHLNDLEASSSPESLQKIHAFRTQFHATYTGEDTPNYGEHVTIQEMWLPVAAARELPGSSNSAVNNSSIITRISCYGYLILICGDMETEAWDFVLNRSPDRARWQQLVSNVNALVAPHHGHDSAYSVDLMRLANPNVVLVSVKSGDEYVDTRYSAINGITVGGEPYKMITTRAKGTIKITVRPPETLLANHTFYVQFDADGRRNRAAVPNELIQSIMNGSFPFPPRNG